MSQNNNYLHNLDCIKKAPLLYLGDICSFLYPNDMNENYYVVFDTSNNIIKYDNNIIREFTNYYMKSNNCNIHTKYLYYYLKLYPCLKFDNKMSLLQIKNIRVNIESFENQLKIIEYFDNMYNNNNNEINEKSDFNDIDYQDNNI
jgi:hypothetical protein